jgi:ABC-type spermidine/putrescine transport system permease subunit I
MNAAFSNPSGRLQPYLLAAPAACLLAFFLIGPLLLLTRLSLHEPAAGQGFYQPGTWTSANLAGYAESTGRDIVLFSVLFGLAVAMSTVVLAYVIAYFIHGLPARAKGLAIAAVLLPKLASVLVIALGLQVMLSGVGPVNRLILALGLTHAPITLTRNLFGAFIGELYLLLPYAILVIVVGLERIDPALACAARGLGATAWQSFGRVTWPLSRPSVVIAWQLSWMWGMAAFVGPWLLGSPQTTTLAIEAQRQAFEYANWPRGAAAAMWLVALVLAGLSLVRVIGRRAAS